MKCLLPKAVSASFPPGNTPVPLSYKSKDSTWSVTNGSNERMRYSQAAEDFVRGCTGVLAVVF